MKTIEILMGDKGLSTEFLSRSKVHDVNTDELRIITDGGIRLKDCCIEKLEVYVKNVGKVENTRSFGVEISNCKIGSINYVSEYLNKIFIKKTDVGIIRAINTIEIVVNNARIQEADICCVDRMSVTFFNKVVINNMYINAKNIKFQFDYYARFNNVYLNATDKCFIYSTNEVEYGYSKVRIPEDTNMKNILHLNTPVNYTTEENPVINIDIKEGCKIFSEVNLDARSKPPFSVRSNLEIESVKGLNKIGSRNWGLSGKLLVMTPDDKVDIDRLEDLKALDVWGYGRGDRVDFTIRKTVHGSITCSSKEVLKRICSKLREHGCKLKTEFNSDVQYELDKLGLEYEIVGGIDDILYRTICKERMLGKFYIDKLVDDIRCVFSNDYVRVKANYNNCISISEQELSSGICIGDKLDRVFVEVINLCDEIGDMETDIIRFMQHSNKRDIDVGNGKDYGISVCETDNDIKVMLTSNNHIWGYNIDKSKYEINQLHCKYSVHNIQTCVYNIHYKIGNTLYRKSYNSGLLDEIAKNIEGIDSSGIVKIRGNINYNGKIGYISDMLCHLLFTRPFARRADGVTVISLYDRILYFDMNNRYICSKLIGEIYEGS